VGFRPFAWRLARELCVRGWARNGAAGLVVEAEAEAQTLREFARRLVNERPAGAHVAAVEQTWLTATGAEGFSIVESRQGERKSAWILPDLAMCAKCREEIEDPAQRRAGYPFTNCTDCGPRFTIIRGIPYDRARTTMAGFPLCPDCRREYEDPGDRRFHAQPVACPACGPHLRLEDGGTIKALGERALEAGALAVEKGLVVALKGLGGFLLLCDARSAQAVARLRRRKARAEKPFALLFPSLDCVRASCEVSEVEAQWMTSPAAPIVLLRRRADAALVCGGVAPGSRWLGAMLPYAPLHHMLSRRLGFPLVATSGNASEEPIAYKDADARRRLTGIADVFLTHDRPIARHADDSIVRLCRGRQSVVRRARGLAPLPLTVKGPLSRVLAVGAHLKSTVAIGWEDRLVVSQHLGDLGTATCRDAFEGAIRDLSALYEFEPEAVACDRHPDYASTRHARAMGLPVVRVQHHHAHVAAVMAEAGLEGPVLGVAFDGMGWGPDATVWGGEFLRVGPAGYARLAHLRTFPLPGGDAANREPRRAALGLLHAAGLDVERMRGQFDAGLWPALRDLPGKPNFSPLSSSAGRLFDAVASLIGLRQVNGFEGQAAIALEQAAEGYDDAEGYPLPVRTQAPLVLDWGPLIEALLLDLDRGRAPGLMAARFHEGLARAVTRTAGLAGLEQVVLCGGVFQNRRLTERAAALMEENGLIAITPQRLPANDGGISAGQAFVAGRGWGTELLPCA
jgi:hydrogenase maturation protein HypF